MGDRSNVSKPIGTRGIVYCRRAARRNSNARASVAFLLLAYDATGLLHPCDA